jgi:hypothetical protein
VVVNFEFGGGTSFRAVRRENMIKQIASITCAYLVIASAAYAADAYDPAYHDSCGGDSCASDAYDLGYRDGYEGDSYTASPRLQNDPQYAAGFSEGGMDAMAEKDPLTGMDGRLSAATDQADTLTAQDAAKDENEKARVRSPTALDEGAEEALIRRSAEAQAHDPRDPLDHINPSLNCQTDSLDCQSDLLDRQTSSVEDKTDLTPNRLLSIESDGYGQSRDPRDP